jgi:methyltransferase OMS1
MMTTMTRIPSSSSSLVAAKVAATTKTSFEKKKKKKINESIFRSSFNKRSCWWCYETHSSSSLSASTAREKKNEDDRKRNKNKTTRREGVLKTGAIVMMSTTQALVFLDATNDKNNNNTARAQEDKEENNKMKENYDTYSRTYDDLDGKKRVVETLGIDQLRTKMFERVKGDVLELAVGTGLNLPYYKRVKSLTAIDLSPGMLEKAEEKFRELEKRDIEDNSDDRRNTNVKFEIANVESLPYEDETFDYVVDTFSMCVFEKPDAALREAKRVLKKGGKLLLFEHSRAKKNALLSTYQSATSGMVKKMAKGCDWSQDVERLVGEAGFTKVTWGPFEEAGGLLEALEVQK